MRSSRRSKVRVHNQASRKHGQKCCCPSIKVLFRKTCTCLRHPMCCLSKCSCCTILLCTEWAPSVLLSSAALSLQPRLEYHGFGHTYTGPVCSFLPLVLARGENVQKRRHLICVLLTHLLTFLVVVPIYFRKGFCTGKNEHHHLASQLSFL